jgi:NAD(P)-dependent dehydrogenase (short-subunit alcohol dehydrogenase family)
MTEGGLQVAGLSANSASRTSETIVPEKAMEKSIPMGRVGRPEEMPNAVLWLCSDAASYVTGQSMSVDGGFVMG